MKYCTRQYTIISPYLGKITYKIYLTKPQRPLCFRIGSADKHVTAKSPQYLAEYQIFMRKRSLNCVKCLIIGFCYALCNFLIDFLKDAQKELKSRVTTAINIITQD